MGLRSIEVVSIPVSDQDQARDFYAESLGFSIDVDAPFAEGMRWVQLTPPGGGASITRVPWNPAMPAGSQKDLYLACEEIGATYEALKTRGVKFADEVFDSPFGQFAHFEDPDGNGWVLHENPS
jgi:predicted enzyme related to lactoylglutathione lyase